MGEKFLVLELFCGGPSVHPLVQAIIVNVVLEVFKIGPFNFNHCRWVYEC